MSHREHCCHYPSVWAGRRKAVAQRNERRKDSHDGSRTHPRFDCRRWWRWPVPLAPAAGDCLGAARAAPRRVVVSARDLNFRTLEVFLGLGLEQQVIAAGTPFSRAFPSQRWLHPNGRSSHRSSRRFTSRPIPNCSPWSHPSGIVPRVGWNRCSWPQPSNAAVMCVTTGNWFPSPRMPRA